MIIINISMMNKIKVFYNSSFFYFNNDYIICRCDYDWEHFNLLYNNDNKIIMNITISSITMTVASITIIINYDSFDDYEESLLLFMYYKC